MRNLYRYRCIRHSPRFVIHTARLFWRVLFSNRSQRCEIVQMFTHFVCIMVMAFVVKIEQCVFRVHLLYLSICMSSVLCAVCTAIHRTRHQIALELSSVFGWLQPPLLHSLSHAQPNLIWRCRNTIINIFSWFYSVLVAQLDLTSIWISFKSVCSLRYDMPTNADKMVQ